MKIIIREEQYQLLLEEKFKSTLISKIDNFKKFTSDVINDLKNSFNFNIKFGLTYGAGIGVVLSHISDYLHGKYTSLTENEIKMLSVAAIMVVFFETKDLLKIEKKFCNFIEFYYSFLSHSFHPIRIHTQIIRVTTRVRERSLRLLIRSLLLKRIGLIGAKRSIQIGMRETCTDAFMTLRERERE